MAEKKPEQFENNQSLSPLGREPSYGERAYHFVFDNLINFWFNLTVSAAFSFWVAHSKNHIKLPFMKEAVMPRDIQLKLGNWLEKTPFLQTMKDPSDRMKRAQSMATALTLLTPGHFIIIPSVWLGPKIKEPFVRFFDRQHYGDEAMDDPTLNRRHQLIAQEERPTIWGALAGRIGGVAVTQFYARTLGTAGNWANIAGNKLNIGFLKKMPGIDPIAEKIGEMGGSNLEQIAPGSMNRVNEHFRKSNYDWSYKQLDDHAMNTSGPYNRTVKDFGRYVGQDVIYTALTSNTVHPIIDGLKKFVPGLTYRPHVANPLPPEASKGMHIRRNPIAREAQETPSDVPATKISASELKHEHRMENPNQEHTQG